MPVSRKICSDIHLVIPLSAFGRSLGLALWLERTLGMEHLDEGRLQPRPSDSRRRGQMLSFSTFRGGANIDALDKIRSPSFSTPVNAGADLCAPMFLLHWSSGKTSTDLLLSLVWKLQWPPTISLKRANCFFISSHAKRLGSNGTAPCFQWKV